MTEQFVSVFWRELNAESHHTALETVSVERPRADICDALIATVELVWPDVPLAVYVVDSGCEAS